MPRTPTITGFVTHGQEIREIRVKDDGDRFTDTKTGDVYAKIGTPKLYVPRLGNKRSAVLLAYERAASYEPPREGGTKVRLRDPETIEAANREAEADFIEVQVTPQLHNALGVEMAAKALQNAQRPPTWLMVICILGGVGVGWILKMLIDLGIAKAAAG